MVERDGPPLDWSKGLIPAVVQDAATLQVLMLAWMDEAALAETVQSGEATFFSRSRQARWRKGETSGNRLRVMSLTADCDGDTILMRVEPAGPACHLRTTSCFGAEDAPGIGGLARLERVIASREGADPATSYTAKIMGKGAKRAAQKVGEEGVETALAGAAGDAGELAEEASDLLYHLLILLRLRGVALADVLAVLAARGK